jgi:Acyl carrier protein
MGLDAVEIVMRIEKTFAIKIDDAEAEAIRTVGDMYEIVWREIDGRASDTCISQSIFYRLRNGITATYGANRAEVTPGIMLAQLIPSNQKTEQWQAFSQHAELKLPNLIYRQPYSGIRDLLVVNIIVCTLILILFAVHRSTWWPLLLCPISYIMLMGFYKIFSSKKTAAPKTDIRQFVSDVLALNFENLKNVKGAPIHISRREMEHVINNIIVDVLGVDIEEVTTEKSFVNDFGL